MSYVEAFCGIGLILGPIFGAALYGPLGYAWTFYIYGAFMIAMAILIKLFFPQQSSQTTLERQIEQSGEERHELIIDQRDSIG